VADVTTFDGIIIGSGHNGLTCAAYLAKAGQRVAVVERNPHIGGGAVTEEATLPGFRHNVHSNFHFFAEGPVYDDLELWRYGLAYIFPEVQHGMAFRDGTALTIHRDPQRTHASIARFSGKDADRYLDLHEKFAVKMRELVNQMLYSHPIPPPVLAERIRGPLAEEMLSYGQMGLYEAVDSNFEDEHVRTLFKGFLHAIALRDLPNLGSFFPRLLSRLLGLGLAVSGAAALPRALVRVIEEHGGTVLTGRHVERVLVEDGGVTGVRLESGEELQANRFVVSAVDAPQTVRMAGAENFGTEIAEKVENLQWADHSLVTLHLALEEPPRYAASEFDPDLDRAFNLVLGADDGHDIDRVFSTVEEGRLPERFFGNGACNTIFDPSLAPPDKHTAFWWPFAPYDLNGDASTWDEQKDEIGAELLRQWREFAPNLTDDNVLATYVFSPLDIERSCINMVKGSHHGAAYLPHQLGGNRPVPELGQYRTPIDGLYLGGFTSHSGGAIMGSPGYNSANAVADDLEIDRWWEALPKPSWEG
jgi:phytoene dehydrogenase-like protein